MPGPGDDEAVYHYWAHHGEPAYAPLLQGALRLSEWAPAHSLLALRAPVILLGVLVLVLIHARMGSGVDGFTRAVVLGAVAVSPWQAFSGSIVHPDNVFLITLLAFVLAVRGGHAITTALAAGAMVLAKPTGVLLVPVAWWMLGRLDAERVRVWSARSLLLAVAVWFASAMSADMVSGLGTFGRLSGSVPVRVGYGLLSVSFLAGPLLIGLAAVGARQRLSLLRQDACSAERREARISVVSAAVLLGFFLGAALLRGQFKGNWVLPAAILLLPVRSFRMPRSLVAGGLAVGVLACVGQAAVLSRADLATRFGGPWRAHLVQYADASSIAAQIDASWRTGAAEPSRWILSDDYGLAAKLHWYLGWDSSRIVVPGHGVYDRTVEAFRTSDVPGPVLVVTRDPACVRSASIGDIVDVESPLSSVRDTLVGASIWVYRGRPTTHEVSP